MKKLTLRKREIGHQLKIERFLFKMSKVTRIF